MEGQLEVKCIFLWSWFSRQIWDEDNPRVDDYVNVPVGNVLQPTDRDFVVGDVIRMHTPLIGQEGMYISTSTC